MTFIRRAFYLILGFTFPGFWILHSSGVLAGLYLPIQELTGSSASSWPSFITAGLLYIGMTLVFEVFYRLLKNAHP